MAGGPIYKGGVPFSKSGVRFKGNAGVFAGAGAPTNGTSGSGAGKFDIGSVYQDSTNGHLYVNQGTKASPTWISMAEAGSAVVPARAEKTAILVLAGAAIHAGAVGLVNPEGVDCIIQNITVSMTTHATAANGLIDVGTTTVSATTASDNLADGLAVGSGVTAPKTYTTVDQGGANGKSTGYWTAGKWITVSDDATADVTGLVGVLYVNYIIA